MNSFTKKIAVSFIFFSFASLLPHILTDMSRRVLRKGFKRYNQVEREALDDRERALRRNDDDARKGKRRQTHSIGSPKRHALECTDGDGGERCYHAPNDTEEQAQSHKFDILSEKLIKLSNNATTWDEAQPQWMIVSLYASTCESYCICTTPIIQNCKIRNRFNMKSCIIGNVCITHFSSGTDDALYRANATEVFEHGRDAYDFMGSLVLIDNKTIKALEKAKDFPEQCTKLHLIVLAHRLAVFTAKEAKEYVELVDRSKTHKLDTETQLHAVAYFNKLLMAGFCETRPVCKCGLPAAPELRARGKQQVLYYRCLHWRDNDDNNDDVGVLLHDCGFSEQGRVGDLRRNVKVRKQQRTAKKKSTPPNKTQVNRSRISATKKQYGLS